MSGKAMIIAGRRGSGKTYFNKELVKNVHPKARLIHDVNQEYRELYPYEFITFQEFLTLTTTVKNAYILFEESTITVAYHGSLEKIRDLVVRARHTNNTVVFVFHSLRAIPRYIFDLCDYLVLFKTNDHENLVRDNFKNPELTEAFLRIKESKWIDSGKKDEFGKAILYSPHEVIDIGS